MVKKLLLALGIILLAIQFYRPDISVPAGFEEGNDILTIYPDASPLLKTTCYDCHSYESKLPWYANFNPPGIFVRNHIRDGRKHLNFSTFQSLSLEKRIHKLEECIEEVEKENMPIQNYTWLHPEAQLTPEQRKELVSWFRQILALQK
jgi:hypothetical protein